MAKKAEYVSKARTTEISATCRAAIKIRDNFYTYEATEKRAIEGEGADLEKEWNLLFVSVDETIGGMIQDLYDRAHKK